jgi:hypothetical protein
MADQQNPLRIDPRLLLKFLEGTEYVGGSGLSGDM